MRIYTQARIVHTDTRQIRYTQTQGTDTRQTKHTHKEIKNESGISHETNTGTRHKNRAPRHTGRQGTRLRNKLYFIC